MKWLLTLLLFSAMHARGQRDDRVQKVLWSVTEVLLHDVANPPAAARFYSYCLLTGYDIAGSLDPKLPYIGNLLSGYPQVRYGSTTKVDKDVAILYGMLETARQMIPSGGLLTRVRDSLLLQLKDMEVRNATASYASSISAQIVRYANADGYLKLSVLARYRPLEGEGYWQPTPPEYMGAVEPNWQTIRTFFRDSLMQVQIPAMIAFSKDSADAFLHQAREVYEVSRTLTQEQKLVANFWDCNPFAVLYEGHMSVGLKKISPGAHWLGIAGIACLDKRLDLVSTLKVHTLLALTLHDAFICCWKEKFRTNRVRPETIINRYFDERWQPLLQTPPFPEYPSGHSVVSTASAMVLTRLLGNVAFTDTVETYMGLPARRFMSFQQAAGEACISRLYGGIHFRDAIENCSKMGAALATMICSRLELRD